MVMKKEFSHDMTEMSKLHKIKEEEYMVKTRNMNADMERMKGKMNDVVRGSVDLEEAARENEAQAARFRKQNQMLAIDLHRINEELYQHWLALKDIKTLSIRLDSFNSFKKIYE